MTTPEPSFSGPEEYRESNRRMAEAILAAPPSPYAEGGYVRRVVEIRGRRSGQVVAVPIAVITLEGRQHLVSPTRDRNWVKNLIAEPECVVVSRDSRETRRAEMLTHLQRIAQVTSTYLRLMNAPWAVAQFPFPADATITMIERAADQVAVFELLALASVGGS